MVAIKESPEGSSPMALSPEADGHSALCTAGAVRRILLYTVLCVLGHLVSNFGMSHGRYSGSIREQCGFDTGYAFWGESFKPCAPALQLAQAAAQGLAFKQ